MVNPQHKVLAEQTGARHGLPPFMLSALVMQESGFCPTAVSSAGAMGLGQLIPSTARSLGVKNAFDPAQNLDGAARYLRAQYLTFKSWPLALAAHNAGPGAVMKYGNTIPPYAETQQYVKRVLGFYSAYTGSKAGPVTAVAAPQPRPQPRPAVAATVRLSVPAPQVSAGVPALDPRVQYAAVPAPSVPVTAARPPVSAPPAPAPIPLPTSTPPAVATTDPNINLPAAAAPITPPTGMLAVIRSAPRATGETFTGTVRASTTGPGAAQLSTVRAGGRAAQTAAEQAQNAAPTDTATSVQTIVRARR